MLFLIFFSIDFGLAGSWIC